MLPRYCFHCHTGGEVVLCSDCHRVYHEACLKEPVKPALESLTQEAFLCSYCKAFQAIAGGGAESTMSKRDRRDLNHLLSLTCQKLRSKMPANLLYREAPERAAQKAQDGVDASDKNAKAVSKLIFHFIFTHNSDKSLNDLSIF